MRAVLRSTIGSALSWCCLFAGLILIADLALTQPLVRLNAASTLLEEEVATQLQLRGETARAERVSHAIASDPIFRDEWLRREWGIDLPASIEQVRVDEGLRLRQPTTTAVDESATIDGPLTLRPWSKPFDMASMIPYPRVVIVVLLAIGILTPSLFGKRRYAR